MLPEQVVIAVAVLLVVSFVLSNVLSDFLQLRRRSERVKAFRSKYEAWATGQEENRDWLLARKAEMQRDAESVELGVQLIAPPPALGGRFQHHEMFTDLLSEQTFADEMVGPQERLDTLTTVEYEVDARRHTAFIRIFNPGSWVRLAFERIARLPRYLLQTAGFSAKVTESGSARVVTAVWSFLVGGATIATFALLIRKG